MTSPEYDVCCVPIYIILSQFGDTTYPRQSELAEYMCMSERVLRLYINELITCGLMRMERRGLCLSNRYILTGQITIEDTAHNTSKTSQERL